MTSFLPALCGLSVAAFPASLSGKPVTGRFFDQTRNSPYNHTTVGVSLKTSVYSKPRISGCCFHSSGFLLCRMFCTQTGRMSGIRRSRPSSCCSLKCWNLKSLHASLYSTSFFLICFSSIFLCPILQKDLLSVKDQPQRQVYESLRKNITIDRIIT